jgi:hypothetical protein
MKMDDLKLAKKELDSTDVNIVFVKNGKIVFSSNEDGVKGFLSAIKKFGVGLSNSSAADRIAGRAVALLCLYAKIKSIFAKTMSESCKDVLQKNGIVFEFEKIVPNILNKDKNGVCPLERLTTKIENPQIAFEELSKFLNLSV